VDCDGITIIFFLLPAVLLKRPSLKVKVIQPPVVFAIGVLDGTAALAYTTATTKGMLSLVSVVSSLYPAVSVILAALILKEQLRGLQFFGVVIGHRECRPHLSWLTRKAAAGRRYALFCTMMLRSNYQAPTVLSRHSAYGPDYFLCDDLLNYGCMSDSDHEIQNKVQTYLLAKSNTR
jgi:hypothetical protein